MAGICESYDLTKIISLQKFFVKNSFKSCLKKNIDIFKKLNSLINIEKNENLFNNSINNFDNLTKFIMKKEVMSTIKQFLDKYYRMVSFNSKGDIISLGHKNGVKFSKTLSCYNPKFKKSCGFCDSCLLRKKGFEEASLIDPNENI